MGTNFPDTVSEYAVSRSKRIDKVLLICLLAGGAVNLFFSDKLFFAATIPVLFLLVSFDNSSFYTSARSLLLPILLLTLVGIVVGLKNNRVDYFRDVYIFSKNIFYFLAGIALTRFIKSIRDFFRYFLILAFLAALIHIGTVAMNFSLEVSLQQIRKMAGFSNSLEGIIIAFCLAFILSKKFRSHIGKLSVMQKLMFAVILISVLAYFSRTMIVVVVVICAFLTDAIYIRKFLSSKNVRLFRAAIFFLSMLYIAYIGALFFPEGSPVRTLAEKFRNIPEEISWSREKNLEASREEIQSNWRGYEAYQGILKYNEGNALQKTFGYGFGSRIDLGLIMKLGGEEYEDVPILHNEYVTLLVKTGVIGLLLYLLFLYQTGFRSISAFENSDQEIYYSYQMLSALSVVSLLNTYIGFGLLDPTNASVPIIMGVFWGIIQRRIFLIKRALIRQRNLDITNITA